MPGVRKRIAAHEAATRKKPSALGKLLAAQFCWGHLSAVAVQQYAAAAVQDGANHADLCRTWGLWRGSADS